ncbi:uncharacterized protein LOC119098881 isoform X2 [Pollicipes pollicipes]|uniref:uncharacterized protein LOC119098881 isoform X2 n=2 Tax=Pollicipes pollicipes TaxID=41117 RepID=UPI001884FA17|nr:uncharacterized protein LOC119098881 isoform X2 [Pollicipes pollicipes]
MVVREVLLPARRGRSDAPHLTPRRTPLAMTEVSAVGADAADCVLAAHRDVDADAAEPVDAPSPSPSPESPSPTSAGEQDPSSQKQSVPRGYIPPALQNCLRCDACSCIYIDELDYYKHVRNYHSASAQRRYRKSSQCRTCVFSKIVPEQVTTLKTLQHQQRQVSPVKINVLQNNVKSRWSRMFASRLRGQLTPLSSGLRAIDPRRVPLKSKVKMQASLQPFVVQELDAKMRAMKRQRATPGDGSATCCGDGSDICAGGATLRVKQEPAGLTEAECAALLQQVEVRIKTEPGELET